MDLSSLDITPEIEARLEAAFQKQVDEVGGLVAHLKSNASDADRSRVIEEMVTREESMADRYSQKCRSLKSSVDKETDAARAALALFSSNLNNFEASLKSLESRCDEFAGAVVVQLRGKCALEFVGELSLKVVLLPNCQPTR